MQFLHHPGLLQGLFLRQQLKRSVLAAFFEILQAPDGLTNGFIVGQHTAQPALINKRHFHAQRLFIDHFGRRTLGADKQNLVAPRCHVTDLD